MKIFYICVILGVISIYSAPILACFFSLWYLFILLLGFILFGVGAWYYPSNNKIKKNVHDRELEK